MVNIDKEFTEFYKDKQTKYGIIYKYCKNISTIHEIFQDISTKMYINMKDNDELKIKDIDNFQKYLTNYFACCVFNLFATKKPGNLLSATSRIYDQDVDITEYEYIQVSTEDIDYQVVYILPVLLKFSISEEKVYRKKYIESKTIKQILSELHMNYSEYYNINCKLTEKIRNNIEKIIL